jgi:hypothetical protein
VLRTWQQERADGIAFAKKLFGEWGDEHEWVATRKQLLYFLEKLEAGDHVEKPSVEEPETRDYKADAAELAGAVLGFIDMLDHVTNDQADLYQLAKDVLAGKTEG